MCNFAHAEVMTLELPGRVSHPGNRVLTTAALTIKNISMKRLVSIILMNVLVCLSITAQEHMDPEETWKCEEVSGSNYHGFAFHKDWDVDVTIDDQQGRFTPTDEEIAQAEKLMQKKLAYVNREHPNQEGMCPIIDEHLREYKRQYVGFLDVHGYRVLWMNFVWDDKVSNQLNKDILLAEGGCGHYWHLLVNLDTEKVYGLEVNGSGTVKYIPRQKRPGPRISKSKNDNQKQRVRKTGIIHKDSEKAF
jgi:hypothetical protein